MGEKLGVVGSRKGADLAAVTRFLHDLHGKHPDWVVVSGGADGVDTLAETTWRNLGHEVWSFRPVKLEHGKGWGFERHVWRPGEIFPTVEVSPYPGVKDVVAALFLRSYYLASEVVQRLVSFQAPHGSPGTSFTLSVARGHLPHGNVLAFGGELASGFGVARGVDLEALAYGAEEAGWGASAEELAALARASGLGDSGESGEGRVHSDRPLRFIDRRPGPGEVWGSAEIVTVYPSSAMQRPYYGLTTEQIWANRMEMLGQLEDVMAYGIQHQASILAGHVPPPREGT